MSQIKSLPRRTVLAAALLAGLCVLAGCEKDIKVELPAQPPRLALMSDVYAGDTFRLQVGRSVSVKESNSNVNMGLDNATALLYENGLLVDTLRSMGPGTYLYAGRTTAVAGNEYRIEVSAPGYPTASAVETAPSVVPVELLGYRPMARRNSDNMMQDEVTFSFDDPPTAGDCYIVRILNYYEDGLFSYGGSCVNTSDISAESAYGSDGIDITTCLSPNAVFFQDALFNGKKKEVKFYVDAMSPWQDSAGDTVRPKLVLLHVSKPYFDFIKTYFGSRDNEGNPFAEPFNVNTNVRNGYGIFSVLSQSRTEIR